MLIKLLHHLGIHFLCHPTTCIIAAREANELEYIMRIREEYGIENKLPSRWYYVEWWKLVIILIVVVNVIFLYVYPAGPPS